MTQLRIRDHIPPADFQTIARVVPPEERSGTNFTVSASETAVVERGGRVEKVFTARSEPILEDSTVTVVSRRRFEVVVGFGDCSGSPYLRSPTAIHLRGPELTTADGEIVRSMTTAIGFELDPDDPASAERLVANAPLERGKMTVKGLAEALEVDIPSMMERSAATTSPTETRSVRFDKHRMAAIETVARGVAAGGLLKYGMAVTGVKLTIVSTSRDTELRQPALDAEADVAHKAEIRDIQREYEKEEGLIDALKKRLEREKLQNQIEMIRTEVLERRAHQAEIEAEIERLDPRIDVRDPYPPTDDVLDIPHPPRSPDIPTDNIGVRRAAFFQGLADRLEIEGFTGPRKAGPDNWMTFPSGAYGITYYAWLASRDEAKVVLVLEHTDRERNKNLFDRLFAQRASIESELGEPLIWDRKDSYKSSHVCVVRPNSSIYADAETLREIQDWMVQKLFTFRTVFGPLVGPDADFHSGYGSGSPQPHRSGAEYGGYTTPLHGAAAQGDTEAVQALIAAGADIEARDEHGQTPLLVAVWAADHVAPTVRALLEGGANTEVKHEGRYPIHLAAGLGDTETVRALISAGAKAEAKADHGLTPVHAAAGNGHADTVNALIDAGAYAEGVTPLHLAAWSGFIDRFRAMISDGADINAKTEHGLTPLHGAAVQGHINVVSAMVSDGADVNAKTEHGLTPLHLAAAGLHADAVYALIDAGADIEAKDEGFDTPLDKAAMSGDIEAIQVLLYAGAKLTNNTVNMARMYGHDQLAQFLEDARPSFCDRLFGG